MHRSRRLLLVLGLAGCDSAASDVDPAEGNTDGASEASAGEAQALDVPVSGLHLTKVSANQGVEVPLVVDGQWVGGADRNAQLIKERETLVRGFIDVDDDFEPREVRARLTLTYAGGREEVGERTLFVEDDSDARHVDSQVWFQLPKEYVEPGVRFQIELFEVDETFADPAAPPAAYPPKPEYLGIETDDMQLRVMLVPVEHALGDAKCPDTPVLDEAAIDAFRDSLYMQNPVHDVEVVVREPFVYEEPLTRFEPLLGALATLRDSDGADPSVYYYGLVRPCDGGPENVAGQAISIPDFPMESNAWTRVALGRWNASLTTTVDTFVHEIGHTQGRSHVACNGIEAGTDPRYPYEGGSIGDWGFGVLDSTLRSASSKDYMTYCGNTWISDWGWRQVVPFIREITTWEKADAAAPSKPLLVGLVDADTGDETWFVTRGELPEGPHASERLEIAAPHSTLEVPLVRGEMGDGNGYSLVAELPEGTDAELELGRVRALTRHSDSERVPVRSVRIRNLHLRL